MNIETGKAARFRSKLVPNPKAKLRDQFHEVARFKYGKARDGCEKPTGRMNQCFNLKNQMAKVTSRMTATSHQNQWMPRGFTFFPPNSSATNLS